MQLRRTLADGRGWRRGLLDPAAIATVAAESWPEVRDADELHDALLTLITLPPVDEWRELFTRASGHGPCQRDRAARQEVLGSHRTAGMLTTDVLAAVRGWMDSIGPVTARIAGRHAGVPTR